MTPDKVVLATALFALFCVAGVLVAEIAKRIRRPRLLPIFIPNAVVDRSAQTGKFVVARGMADCKDRFL